MIGIILFLALITNSPTNYECTAYCPCEQCNGNSLQIAKNGDPLIPNYSIAVDPEVIPFNTIVYIQGVGIRKAVDTGAFSGHRIDILYSTHEKALEFGRKDKKVCSLLSP